MKYSYFVRGRASAVLDYSCRARKTVRRRRIRPGHRSPDVTRACFMYETRRPRRHCSARKFMPELLDVSFVEIGRVVFGRCRGRTSISSAFSITRPCVVNFLTGRFQFGHIILTIFVSVRAPRIEHAVPWSERISRIPNLTGRERLSFWVNGPERA